MRSCRNSPAGSAEHVKQTMVFVPAGDGHRIENYVNQPTSSRVGTGPQPAIVYMHSGGLVALTAKICQPYAAALAQTTGRPVFNVEYRLSTEAAFPAPFDDAYTALEHIHSHAADFNIDPARISVHGDSAGGNLAIALTLRARDERLNPPLAQVVAAYPMLDDRTTKATPEAMRDKLAWKELDNEFAWRTYLGDQYGTEHVSPYAAPARADDLAGLPPIYIDCGGLDLFLAEIVQFAARLIAAGNATELHILPGVPHAFEFTAPSVKVSQITLGARYAALMRS